jgi:hypothetical protein
MQSPAASLDVSLDHAARCFPLAHEEHADCRSAFWNLPAVQPSQATLGPAAALNLPAGQGKQPMQLLSLKCPAGHGLPSAAHVGAGVGAGVHVAIVGNVQQLDMVMEVPSHAMNVTVPDDLYTSGPFDAMLPMNVVVPSMVMVPEETNIAPPS